MDAGTRLPLSHRPLTTTALPTSMLPLGNTSTRISGWILQCHRYRIGRAEFETVPGRIAGDSAMPIGRRRAGSLQATSSG